MINLPTYVYYKFLGTPPITTSMQRDAYFSCILPNNKDGTFYKMMSHLTIPNYKRSVQYSTWKLIELHTNQSFIILI